jgi:group I intron endonuclease
MMCAGFNHLLADQKVCGIYKITSSNFRIYIGQSIDIGKRIRGYKAGRMKTQRKLKYSVAKHGWPGHVVEVLQVCEPVELDDLERHYIKLYDTFNTSHGMNLTEGGNRNTHVSEETRVKMSESRRGEKNPLFGKTHTQVAKDKMSNAHKGRKMKPEQLAMLVKINTGRVKTEEEIEKVRQSKIGKKRPDHVKRRLSEVRSAPVILIKDTAIVELKSMDECSSFLGRNRKSIRQAILQNKPCRGYFIYYL